MGNQFFLLNEKFEDQHQQFDTVFDYKEADKFQLSKTYGIIQNGKRGIVDSTGKLIIKPLYEHINVIPMYVGSSSSADNYFFVCKYFVNTSSNWINSSLVFLTILMFLFSILSVSIEFFNVIIFRVLITFKNRMDTTTTKQAVIKMIFEKESLARFIMLQQLYYLNLKVFSGYQDCNNSSQNTK